MANKNLGDALLRVPGSLRPLIRSLPLPQPPVLHRGAPAPFRRLSQPGLALQNQTIAIVGAATSSTSLGDAVEACGGTVAPDDGATVDGAIVDATHLGVGDVSTDSLAVLFETTQAVLPRLVVGGRLTVVGRHPGAEVPAPPAVVGGAQPVTASAALAQHAVSSGLPGFVRSLAKELGRKACTANLLQTPDVSSDAMHAPLSYLQASDSAFVTGQTLVVGRQVAPPSGGLPPHDAPQLAGKVALVTGAARGIGARIAERLCDEGAHVVGVDVEASAPSLEALCARLKAATPLLLDVTAEAAPEQLASTLKDSFGGVDIVVHNAGITRDKTLARMKPEQYRAVLDVNLNAILRVTDALMAGEDAALRFDGARVVLMASISGIAGAAGQTNYGFTKAALTGYAAGLGSLLAPRGTTVNAIAPGFIETDMTAAMPFLPRELGRRMSAFSQGGLPWDVAAAVAFMASPAAYGVTGQTLRVCGGNVAGC